MLLHTAQASIASNQALLRGFFTSVRHVLRTDGQVRVTLRECPPYTRWKVVEQAESCGLALRFAEDFRPDDYPEYDWVSTKVVSDVVRKKRQRQEKQTASRVYSFYDPENATCSEVPKNSEVAKTFDEFGS